MPNDRIDARSIATCIDRMLSVNLSLAAGVLAAPIEDRTGQLFPMELEGIRHAVPKRRHEFATGRALAREALASIGYDPQPIPVDCHRRPVWPTGAIGSVSHSGSVCAVIVARTLDISSIGLDIEQTADVSGELMCRIARSEEIRRNRSKVSEHDLPACLFSAREAFFKAYHPVTDVFLDFHDVEITLSGANGMFTAELLDPDKPPLFGRRVFQGSYGLNQGFALAVLATKAQPPNFAGTVDLIAKLSDEPDSYYL